MVSTNAPGVGNQVSEIVPRQQWDLVELLVVGNEALYNNDCSSEEFATFISATKDQVAQTGYTGPVTTTDILASWQSNSSTLCSVIDVVAAKLQLLQQQHSHGPSRPLRGE